MYSVKEILGLVCIQYSNSLALEFVKSLTSEECEARVIGKETQRRYGIKSPKLSKALIRLGLPEKVVSQALSSPNISEVARVTADVRDLLEMGDSVHYKSCQRAGSPLRTVEELTPYLGTHLWLYVVGQRQSVEGKGFIARRLLRMMFKDQLCTKPAGVYIERAYGDQSLLPNEVLSDFFGLPVLEYSSEVKEIPLFCPSALHGYNDTLARGLAQNRYSPVECKKKSVVWVAYTGRHMQSGVYHCSLAQHRYNPQNQRFTSPALPNPWRGLVSKEERSLIEVWIGLFGYPQERMERTTYFDIVSCSSSVGNLKVMVYKQDHRVLASVVDEVLDPQYFLEISKSKLEVVEDIEELGFFKPVSVLTKWISKEGTVIDQDLELVSFWIDCFGYPNEGEKFTLTHQNAQITHMGKRYIVRYYSGSEIAIILSFQNEEKHFFSYYPRRKESRVYLSMPELGFERAISIEMGEATSVVSSLLGFCPTNVGQNFTFGDSVLSIWVSSGIRVGITKPGQKFERTLLEVQNCKVEVHQDCPELGFWKAVTLEEELYGDTYYSDRRTVQRDYPELGFWKAVPVICYKVNDKLWVTGPLPTK